HHRFYSRLDHPLKGGLCKLSRHGDHRNFDFILFDPRRKAFYVENGNIAYFFPDLPRIGIKKSGHCEISFPESVIVGECRAESAGPDNTNAMLLIEPKDPCQVVSQGRDVIPNTTYAKFTKICQVFSYLS